jgi:hypothetical protein
MLQKTEMRNPGRVGFSTLAPHENATNAQLPRRDLRLLCGKVLSLPPSLAGHGVTTLGHGSGCEQTAPCLT